MHLRTMHLRTKFCNLDLANNDLDAGAATPAMKAVLLIALQKQLATYSFVATATELQQIQKKLQTE